MRSRSQHSHHSTSKKLFYKSALRFVIIFGLASFLPILLVKLMFVFSPETINQSLINILLSFYAYMAILVACIYAMTQHSMVSKSLKPVTKLAQVGDVASKVVHDIRSPLSALQTVLAHVQQNPDAKMGEYANLLEVGAHRLKGISRDLLALYTHGPQKEHEAENQAEFDIHEILDEQVYEFSSQPEYSNVKFSKRYTQYPIAINLNKTNIERVINNILKNSAEAMKFKGEIVIETSIKGKKAVIGLTDNGPGLSPQKIKKILAGSFTEGKKDGHGIGLSYVQEVLEECGGRLLIQPNPTGSSGACFQIELPIVSQTHLSFNIQVPPGGKVLVIDDDAVYLEEWRLRLQKLGVEAILCASYEDILCRIDSLDYSAAIVDYNFGNSKLNGLEIIKLLQKNCAHTYLCSGDYWKPTIKKQATQLGISICPKPLPDIKLSLPGTPPQHIQA